MSRNVGAMDRVIRIVIGLALLASFFIDSDASYRWLYLLGILPLATGLLGVCGLYALVGVNTCPLRNRAR